MINSTGTLSYKGAAYLGSLIFFASTGPSVCIFLELYQTLLIHSQIIAAVVTEKRPLDTVAVGVVTKVFETVGLSLFLTYWGTRTDLLD